MSATPPTGLEGTQAPSPVELLWERYRSLILTVVVAAIAALGINYGWKYYERSQVDQRWSSFVSALGLRQTYEDPTKAFVGTEDILAKVDLPQLEQAAREAGPAQQPWLLYALARKSMLAAQWEQAEGALATLEQKYPQHTLVRQSEVPVQVRRPVKDDETSTQRPKRPQWNPAEAGSLVARTRAQIAAAREFTVPERFAKPEVPADAPKVKFEVGERGSFTIALMPNAPKLTEKFLELARQEHWKGMAIDEIQRPARNFRQPVGLHLGFETTKDEEDRTKWTTTEPSKNPVEFEATDLSHFAGAVSARSEAGGKSAADRFWVMVDDAPMQDGDRVVFGYVTEGLDVLRDLVESATLSAQDEDRGRGRPSENLRVTGVSVL